MAKPKSNSIVEGPSIFCLFSVNGGLKSQPLGGAKTDHFGFGRDARHEVTASQPRSPDSWRLTGRLGP